MITRPAELSSVECGSVVAPLRRVFFFFKRPGHPRDLPSSPTRPSPDLVCAMEPLQRRGVGGVGLKWPNALLINDRKLGGILIELRAEPPAPACVVIGIGLNIALGAP